MKTFLLEITLLCLCAISYPVLAQEKKQGKPPVISFAHLTAEQQIVIDFDSRGCFHHNHFVLTYVSQPTGHFSQWAGEIKVSPKQIIQLDNLMAFYRRPKSGGCTTVDHIKVRLMQQDKVLVSESFVDGSGWTTLIPTLLKYSPESLKNMRLTKVDKENIDLLRNSITFDYFDKATN